MTKDDIIKLAREAGLCDEEGRDDSSVIIENHLKRFAALVIANNPPQSSMAWQEGNEAGRLAEREACAKACEHQPHWAACAAAIRARGNK